MQPRVSKRERRLQLSYELPYRVHCVQLYPVTAPNGSTVVIYGHEAGIRILWRGGRRRRERQGFPPAPEPPKTNGLGSEVIVLDSDDEGPSQQTEPASESEYEAEEEEQDPDCPYPSVIQHVDVNVGPGILHLAVPSIPNSASTPDFLKRVALVAAATSTGEIYVLEIPLAPPADAEKQDYQVAITQSRIELATQGPLASDLSAKIFVLGDEEHASLGGEQSEGKARLVVVSASRNLSIWTMALTAQRLQRTRNYSSKRVHLPAPACQVTFHPSMKSSQLLLAERSGAVRIYDPFASPSPITRPSSRDSIHEPTSSSDLGEWIAAFQTSFTTSPLSTTHPELARRKTILSARWILNGQALLTLLEDGEWGIWDLSATLNISTFALRGHLDSSTSASSERDRASSTTASNFTPATPNTRKTKAEHLFKGTTRPPGSAPRGGISISPSPPPRTGAAADESAVLWYNDTLYAITSVQAFWDRRKSSSTSGGLYAPGITQLTDISLLNDSVTDVGQFPAQNSAADIGAMHTQRDVLVAGEHRLVIAQSVRTATTGESRRGGGLFAKERAEREAAAAGRDDQAMLDVGGLDLGGLDRMLDGMATGGGVPAGGRARRVGFAPAAV